MDKLGKTIRGLEKCPKNVRFSELKKYATAILGNQETSLPATMSIKCRGKVIQELISKKAKGAKQSPIR